MKTVVSRWWSQYTKLPWPDSMALQLHGLVIFEEKEEEAGQFVHSVMRYMVLSYVLSVRRISKVTLLLGGQAPPSCCRSFKIYFLVTRSSSRQG